MAKQKMAIPTVDVGVQSSCPSPHPSGLSKNSQEDIDNKLTPYISFSKVQEVRNQLKENFIYSDRNILLENYHDKDDLKDCTS